MAKFRKITHEHAKRIQFDVQVYYTNSDFSSPLASLYTPSDRREREAREPGGWEDYWKSRKNVKWYIMVDDDDKPEYGEETG